MSLLDKYFLHPIEVVGTSSLHEIHHAINPLVHAVEGPVSNVWQDSQEVVGGLYRATRGVMNMMPYLVGGWLVWTAAELYLPEEAQAVYRTVENAAKRMRLR